MYYMIQLYKTTFFAQKNGTALQVANLIQNFKERKYNIPILY